MRQKSLGGKKDLCGAVWEIAATAEFRRISSGGTDADAKICAQGFISHMVKGKESRWCIPEHLIQLKALWVKDGCLEELPCTNADLEL